jgi:hypothetical protein
MLEKYTSLRGEQDGNSLFHLVLIKPTHYDNDGYPIQWKKTGIPSNSLACIIGLAEDAADRKLLGPDVAYRMHIFEETCQTVHPKKIIREIERTGGKALIALVGVQSNQFPRAVDLAQPFLDAKLPVCIGGFHVSGCLAMLDEMPAELIEAQAKGISFFAGEAEAGRFDQVMRDAWNGALQPLYNYMDDLPSLTGEPTPILPREVIERIDGRVSCMDLGRGCPFQCSFCTIINVQGRKSRSRNADDLERTIRRNYAAGIRRFFITDDNFARNAEWEPLFDRLIHLRKSEDLKVGLVLQVDTLCHKIPGFIEKAAEAGTEFAFVGLENINSDSLLGAKKNQNKITDYRNLFQKWHAHGVITLAGYIIGFPQDTKESIVRDIEIIKRELPVDILEFFNLTPLPGSEDHKVALGKGEWMDPDLNKYDVTHRVTRHPKMSDKEWDEAYLAAWRTFYTPEHVRTVMRRAGTNPNIKLRQIRNILLLFSETYELEGVHPLEGGLFRIKTRTQRRSTMRRESPILFYPRYWFETARKILHLRSVFKEFENLERDVAAAPDRYEYRDLATTPADKTEFDTLELYHATRGGEDALARKRLGDTIRARTDERVAALPSA